MINKIIRIKNSTWHFMSPGQKWKIKAVFENKYALENLDIHDKPLGHPGWWVNKEDVYTNIDKIRERLGIK